MLSMALCGSVTTTTMQPRHAVRFLALNPLLVWLSTLLRYLLSDSSVVRHSASPYCFLDSNASGGYTPRWYRMLRLRA